AAPRAPRSFPTRRSSDLGARRGGCRRRQRLGHQRAGEVDRRPLPRRLAPSRADGRRGPRRAPHPLGHRVPGHRADGSARLRAGARLMTATIERSAPAPETPGADGARISRRRERRKLAVLATGLLVSALALVTAVTIGTSGVGMGDVLRSVQVGLFGGTISAEFASTYAVITQLRLPRVLLAFTAGAALSVSGVLMQGLLRN